ncbi:MAG TPA: hypothetical protein VGA13_06465 [Acidimicrobiales bacterium]
MSDNPPSVTSPEPPSAYTTSDTPTPSTVRSGISNGRLFGLLLGVAILAGGGFLAANIVGGGGDGPTKAVDRLFQATSDEDLLGAMAAIDPREREAIQPGVEGIADELGRLGIVSDALDLNGIAGIDFEFSGLEYETEALTDDLVTVRVVAGTVTSTAVPSELPAGPALDELGVIPPDDAETETEDFAEEELALVAIRRDGSWWVSVGFSIADAARRDEGLAFPAPADWLEPAGAETPEGVVDLLTGALADLDAAAAFAALAPGEMDPIHAFAPIWVAEAEQVTEGGWAGLGVDRFDLDFDVVTETDGDRAHLTFHGMSLAVETEGVTMGVEYADGCSTVTIDPPPPAGSEDAFLPFPIPGFTGFGEPICATGDGALFGLEELYDAGGLGPDAAALFAELPIDFERLGTIGLEVVRVDGAWYLSPTATALDTVERVLSSLNDDAVSWFATNGEPLAEAFFTLAFGTFGGYEEVSSFTVEGTVDSAGTAEFGGEPVPTPLEICELFLEAVDNGEMEAEFLPEDC